MERPRMMKLSGIVMISIACLMCTLAVAQEPHDGESLIRAMHDRYQASWYKTVTFTQKSTTFNADGTTKVETWYEAASLPGKLRIDIGDPSANNGYLMTDGSLTIVKNGEATAPRPYVNMLLVLGFDAYTQDPAVTAKVAKDEGYDLSKLHEDTWNGKQVYVVGAGKGDVKSKQFWVEKDSLLFVRVFESGRGDATKVNDVRFLDYRKLADAWIAARVEVHSDDKLTFSEDYTDIQANVKLDSSTFDPKQFATTHWEKP
jgi:outer membrane lipoprotein-sorting protein